MTHPKTETQTVINKKNEKYKKDFDNENKTEFILLETMES